MDEILFELIYIKDGVSDEPIFRTRVAEILAQTQDMADVVARVS